jgi:hypothetical protein
LVVQKPFKIKGGWIGWVIETSHSATGIRLTNIVEVSRYFIGDLSLLPVFADIFGASDPVTFLRHP